MQSLSTLLIVLVVFVNLAPVIGVLSGARLEALYGIAFEGADLLVLMRHRAVLFGIVGGLLLVSAFHPPLRNVATVCGLVSMLSFVILVLIGGETNASLHRLGVIDAVASMLLIGSWGIDRWLAA